MNFHSFAGIRLSSSKTTYDRNDLTMMFPFLRRNSA